MTTPRWLRLTGQSVSNNSPAILSGLAIAGVIGTVVLAVKATPKAIEAIREANNEKAFEVGPLMTGEDLDRKDRITVLETVSVTWKFYLPAGISGVATIACILGANAIGARRNAALLGAYTLANTAFNEYKEKVLEQVGANKERKIRDEVASAQVDRQPVATSQVIVTGGGDQLCFDTLTGRYFKSDVDKINRAEVELNRRVLADLYAPHTDFYELLNLDGTPLSDELGWNIDNMLEIHFTAKLSEEGQPCLAITYVRLPIPNFGKIH